jgi:1-acyl-sn-glycerol-3-phosphate acyltransferase
MALGSSIEDPDTSLGSPLRRNPVWFALQVTMRIVFTVWLRYRAKGIERVPAESGALILANHQSFLDPLLIGLPLKRPVSYLARENLFRVPVVGWILRNTYVMPLNIDGASLAGIRQTLKRMRQGFLVGVFPEGTRSPDGTVGQLKPGFTTLVKRVETPIIPVGIAGAHRALGLGHRLLKPERVCVVFGEPIPPEALAPYRQRGREEDLIAFVREKILACVEEAELWLHDQARVPADEDIDWPKPVESVT